MKVHIHLSSEFPEPLTPDDAFQLRQTLAAAVSKFGGRVSDIRTTPGRPCCCRRTPRPARPHLVWRLALRAVTHAREAHKLLDRRVGAGHKLAPPLDLLPAGQRRRTAAWAGGSRGRGRRPSWFSVTDS